MELRELLETMLAYVLYPVWLIAGAGDYLCHRRTDIEHTSGHGESWYHVLQFACLLTALSIAVLLQASLPLFIVVVGLVLAHSVIAFMDVAYTDGKRFISPLEQTIHGYMEVLPWVAAALYGILHWVQIAGDGAVVSLAFKDAADSGDAMVIVSYVVLAGMPVCEELIRTRRARGRRAQAGLATIK